MRERLEARVLGDVDSVLTKAQRLRPLAVEILR